MQTGAIGEDLIEGLEDPRLKGRQKKKNNLAGNILV